MIIDKQAIGTEFVPTHKIKANFLDSYTEQLCIVFQQYLLGCLNGECPANYFRPFRKMFKAATKAGYFRVNPADDVHGKEKKNVRRKQNLEAEDYVKLLTTPHFNEEIREAFIFSRYQNLRHCDVVILSWEMIDLEKRYGDLTQEKTDVPVILMLHPITVKILMKRRDRLSNPKGLVFDLLSLRACNYALIVWCRNAGVTSHITWHCARLSSSIFLQDQNVDAVTVALLMGLTTVKYLYENYRQRRPKNSLESIKMLPVPTDNYIG